MPGAERNNRFSYQTQGGQLCDSDTITVLEQIGTRLTPSFTCRLGDFVPITREEIEDLKLEDEGAALNRNAIRPSAPSFRRKARRRRDGRAPTADAARRTTAARRRRPGKAFEARATARLGSYGTLNGSAVPFKVMAPFVTRARRDSASPASSSNPWPTSVDEHQAGLRLGE